MHGEINLIRTLKKKKAPKTDKSIERMAFVDLGRGGSGLTSMARGVKSERGRC